MRVEDHPLWPSISPLRVPLVPELELLLLDPTSAAWNSTDPDALGWPYWAFAWPGGQALARALFDSPQLVRGQRVVSFGCGGGIEALAAAKVGAREVLGSDLDPLACEVARRNAALNAVTLSTTTDDLIDVELDTDVLLLGDACYDDALASRVLPWLQRLAARGVTVLLGDPERVDLGARADLELLTTVFAPHDGDPRGGTRWPVKVLRVRAPSRP
jgi:predicted nicotinamide N-methyase